MRASRTAASMLMGDTERKRQRESGKEGGRNGRKRKREGGRRETGREG